MLYDFIEVVRMTAERLPQSKLAIVKPMSRPAISWYTEGLTEFTKEYGRQHAG